MGPPHRGQRVTLKGVMAVRRKGGGVDYYLRRKGQPLVRLPDLPPDDPAFIAAWAAAVRDGQPAAPQPGAGSLAALIRAAARDDRTKALSASYRAALAREWEAIRVDYGDLQARGMREKHLRADVAKAAAPLGRLKAWRYLCTVGLARGLLDSNPAARVTPPVRAATGGHEPWTADDVTAFRARWPVGSVPRAAMELLLWTGCRLGDVVLIGRQHVDRDGVLCFRQSKTGDMAYVPWTCPLPDYGRGMEADRAAMHGALIASRGLSFLPTAGGAPRSSKGLGTVIRDAAVKAGLVHRSAHGLRKSRAVALADAGATTHQIAAWTGHKTLKEIERYTARAARRHAVMGTPAEQPLQRDPAQSATS